MLTLCLVNVYAKVLHANVCKPYTAQRPTANLFLNSNENPFFPRWTEKVFLGKKKSSNHLPTEKSPFAQ